MEDTRVMPPGTPFPGPVDLRLTPHIREWLENMSPYSPIQHQAILKAAQIAATFAAECIIGYWMKESPTAIMFLSATQILLEKWGTKRLEPMIDSMGIRELIIQNTESTFSKSSRRTGDKMFSKLLIGGFLEMASAQSPGSQRSDSIRLLVRDEISGCPKNLTTGEGSFIKTTNARTKMWGARKKITDMSTPTNVGECLISELYEDGDKRHYMVPCPMCNKMQELAPFPEEGSHGLRGDYEAGRLKKVYYLCEYCHDAIFDISKYSMFNAGKWEPTATSTEETFRSYYINTLYSPPGTVTWKDYYKEWIKSKDNPEDYKGFKNLYAGLPYKEEGERPKKEKVIELRGSYKVGTIPSGVLFLTGGGDVQEGKREYEKITDKEVEAFLAQKDKKKYNPLHLPRIELEILGTGGGYRMWSVDYMVFYGSIKDAHSGAWEKLYKWGEETRGEYSRADGMSFFPQIFFIDSGDGNFTDVVYQFCGRYQSAFFPIKGYGNIKRKKNEAAGRQSGAFDEVSEMNYLRYRYSTSGGTKIYTIATNHYKHKIYNNLKIGRIQKEVQSPGFYDFPAEYGRMGTKYEKYFDMLTAEEQLTNGSFDAGSRRNEALDCRVYALCASDVYLEERVKKAREWFIEKGGTKKDAEKKINTRFILDDLKKETNNLNYYKNDY